MNLNILGWNSLYEDAFKKQSGDARFIPARVTRENRDRYEVISEIGYMWAILSGSFSYKTKNGNRPAVGDWVIIDAIPTENKAIIHGLLPRMTCLARKTAGETTEEQVLAANVDRVFIVTGLNRDFNVRRIERYLALVKNQHIEPVILLNKADLCPDPLSALVEVQNIAPETAVHYLSAAHEDDISFLWRYLTEGITGVLVGSSGAGKSTIINRLLGADILRTEEISAAINKGTHTTTWRELIVLPQGGMVIDTPGLRELQLWVDEDDLSETFTDIADLAVNCRFRNCTHTNEPGCAVLEAIEQGILGMDRLANFRKMKKEVMYLERRRDQKARMADELKWKQISKKGKMIEKQRY